MCALCMDYIHGPVDSLFHEEGAQVGLGKGRDPCGLGIRVVVFALVLSSRGERNGF